MFLSSIVLLAYSKKMTQISKFRA